MVELTLRLGLSLFAVLGLGWLIVRTVNGPPTRRGRLTLLARQQLTRGSAVAIVQVADRALVLGVTEHGVSLLTETEVELICDRPAPPPPSQVALSALRVLRERTGRHP